MVRNGKIWTIGEQLYTIDYPIMFHQKIKVYRVETINLGISHWNNGFIGMILLEQWCQWNHSTYRTRQDTLVGFLLGYVRKWNDMLNNV